jgi:NADPH:quinone reductase-like Zn-dependent oxidoreductase
MKAIMIAKYGAPEVLRVQEVKDPVPKEGEMLIRIKATVAADPDCAFRSGKPFISRFFTGLTKPKVIPGDVFAGVVEQAGKSAFHVGDKVYGSSGTNFGTNAELISLSEAEAMTPMPKNMTFEEAAAVSEGALTALPFLRDHAKLNKGQRILINGASGGVGVYAMQLAKTFGAHVSAVCGPKNIELMRELGADSVIDYTKEDFTKAQIRYDVIFDAVGKSLYKKCKNALMSNGIYLTTVPTACAMMSMMFTSKSKGKRCRFAATGLRKPAEKKKDLEYLNTLIEQGKLKAVIGRSFDFQQMADAHRYVETGHKRGSAVVRIG